MAFPTNTDNVIAKLQEELDRELANGVTSTVLPVLTSLKTVRQSAAGGGGGGASSGGGVAVLYDIVGGTTGLFGGWDIAGAKVYPASGGAAITVGTAGGEATNIRVPSSSSSASTLTVIANSTKIIEIPEPGDAAVAGSATIPFRPAAGAVALSSTPTARNGIPTSATAIALTVWPSTLTRNDLSDTNQAYLASLTLLYTIDGTTPAWGTNDLAPNGAALKYGDRLTLSRADALNLRVLSNSDTNATTPTSPGRPQITFYGLEGGTPTAPVYTPYDWSLLGNNTQPDTSATEATSSSILTALTTGTVHTDLDAILTELKGDRAIASQMYTDSTNAIYLRVLSYNQQTNAYESTALTLAGAAYTPTAPEVPLSRTDVDTTETVWEITAAGTGYSSGDFVSQFTLISQGPPAAVSAVLWYNQNTSAAIAAPLVGHRRRVGTVGATEATLSTRLAEGTPLTGQALETGGASGLGWLSSIRKAITDRLPAALVGGRLAVDGSGVVQPTRRQGLTYLYDTGSNATVTVTVPSAAAGQRNVVEQVIFSFSGAGLPIAGVPLTLTGSSTISFDITNIGVGPIDLSFPGATAGGITATLGAGGAGVVGKLTVGYRTEVV